MPRSGTATAEPEAETGAETQPEKASKTRKPMSAAHKQSLAEGREHGRAVRAYLEALEDQRPKRGRKATPESIKEKIQKIDADLATANAFTRLQLIQDKMDLQAQLDRLQEVSDLDELEKQFVKVAKPYAERRNISYHAFREVGVPPKVLEAAGLTRSA